MKVVFDISDKLARIVRMAFSPAAIMRELSEIKESLTTIMQNQSDFDTKITAANDALDTISSDVTSIKDAVSAEAKQIADFIAAHPNVNTSALDGVVDRLNTVSEGLANVADSVSGIFTPPEEAAA